MAGEALRTLFAELGFEVDEGVIERANALVDKLSAALGDVVPAAAKAGDAVDAAAKQEQAQSKQALAAIELVAKARENAEKERLEYAAKKTFDASAAGQEHAAWKRVKEAEEDAAKPLKTYADLLARVDKVATGLLARKLGPHLDRLQQRLPVLNGLMQRFGLQNASASVKMALLAGASVAAVAALRHVASAAFEFADAFAAQSEELRDTSRELRLSTTQLQEFDYIATQSGIGVERMRAGLNTFATALRQGERWGNGTTWMLRRLGVQARDTNGHIRPTAELFDESFEALRRIENPYRRLRVAQQLYGDSARRMLDLTAEGAAGIRRYREELAELGGGVTPEAVAASREYTQAQEKWKRGTDSLRSVLAVSLLPVLSWVTTKAAQIAGWWARLTNGTHLLDVALIALGVVGAAVAASLIIAWAPVIAPILLVAAKIAFLILLFDDLWTFIEGGDSAIGRFIDSMFGVGTSADLVRELRDDWEGIVDWISRAIEKVEGFVLAMQGVDDARPEWMRTGAAPPPVRVRPRPGAAPTSASTGGVRVRAAGASVDLPATTGANFSNQNRMADRTGLFAVPATRTVSAPGGGARTVVHQTQRSVVNHNSFALAGPDARQLAGQVGQILEQQARDQRDADHPVSDDDG